MSNVKDKSAGRSLAEEIQIFEEGVKDLYFGTVDTSTANWSGSIREVHDGIC